MESLAAKLTNLSYEIFGIFAPGVIGIVFFLFYWWCLGAVPEAVSGGALPSFTYSELRDHDYKAFDLIVAGVIAYFVGHLLFWLGRKHGEPQSSWWQRVLSCLRFRIPRSKIKFHDNQVDLLVATAAKLGIPNDEMLWERFFPIAKVILSQNLTRSIVSTYQNKYTLHRSITAAASLLFWTLFASTLALLLVSGLSLCVISVEPRWAMLYLGMAASLVIVWGFSDSFSYNWVMLGNALITESFAVISGSVGDWNERNKANHSK